MFWRINPLELVNQEKVRKKVALLEKNNPKLCKRDLCDIIIAHKAWWCALIGALTALPGIIPGVGTLLALVGGTAFDIIALMYFLSEMITEMALVYGRDLRKQGAVKEIAWVFMFSIGSDAVSKNISKIAVKQMGRQAFIKFTQDLLISVGIRASQRSIFRIIPVMGSLLSALVNLFFCRKAGKIVADYYEKSKPDDWEGVTLDI